MSTDQEHDPGIDPGIDAGTDLGIDLGTQSVKVAAVRAGQVVASATRGYRVDSPEPGWAQTDPAAWLSAIDEAVAEVVARTGAPRAVGLSGQMHGVVAADDRLEPVSPGIVWADGRSAVQADRIAQRLGRATLARLGSAAFPGFLGPTVAWLGEHEPRVMARTRWLLSPKDFVRARLTGDVATEVSDASATLLLDVATGRWDAQALEACGVDPGLLAPIIASDARAGVIAHGPLTGVPIATGGADTACVLHGLGLGPGEGYVGLGSGTQIVSACAEPVLDETLRTHTFATVGAPGDGWYRMAAVQSGGLTLERALAWLGASPDEAAAALAQGIRAEDPYFLPFLAGERTPYLDPDLRGSWSGLSLATDRAAMLRSVLEGMACTAAVAAQAMADVIPRSPVPVLGGGSRDRAYLALIADLTGLELVPVAGGDGAVLGAARLAASMLGNDLPGSLDRGALGDVVGPQETAISADRFAHWQRLVDATLGA